MYRMQKIDAALDLHALADPQGRPRRLPRARTGRLEVAVALGLDPVTAYSRERAAAEAHRRADARRLPARRAGRARQGKTVDLEVPANAEIVLEGYDRRTATWAIEGPFGDHTGYYTPAEPFPVFHVTAMTMRRDAIYPSIVVGKPPAGGRLARQGDRADLPARDPDDRARDRRLRPAGRRRVPQLRDRLDPQGASPATRRR